jgi:hypothetical protein
MSLQARAQAATTEYQKLQIDLQNAVEARQRLDSQLQENEMVKKVRKGYPLSVTRLMLQSSAGVCTVDAK